MENPAFFVNEGLFNSGRKFFLYSKFEASRPCCGKSLPRYCIVNQELEVIYCVNQFMFELLYELHHLIGIAIQFSSNFLQKFIKLGFFLTNLLFRAYKSAFSHLLRVSKVPGYLKRLSATFLMELAWDISR